MQGATHRGSNESTRVVEGVSHPLDRLTDKLTNLAVVPIMVLAERALHSFGALRLQCLKWTIRFSMIKP